MKGVPFLIGFIEIGVEWWVRTVSYAIHGLCNGDTDQVATLFADFTNIPQIEAGPLPCAFPKPPR